MNTPKARKIAKRVNGSIAIYYGMGSALTSFGSIISIFVWSYKVWVGKTEFAWVSPIALLLLAGITGFVAYLLLRVGYEEIES
jgi:hypothetical protein